MRTDEIRVADLPQAADALDKIEYIALYAGMSRREASSMRLMAEELLSATKPVLDVYEGRLWMETDADAFTLHLSVDKPLDRADREKLIALSKKGEITPSKGLFARLGAALEKLLMLEENELTDQAFVDYAMFDSGMYSFQSIRAYHYMPWAHAARPEAEEKPVDELEGIEKSIIDAIVDDILVTLQKGQVEIIAIKKLKK